MIIEETVYRTEFHEGLYRNGPLHHRRFYYFNDRKFFIDQKDKIFTICEVRGYLPYPVVDNGQTEFVVTTWEDAEQILCSILGEELERH